MIPYSHRLRFFGALIIVIFAAAHLVGITAEPVDHSSWRQVDTMGVARSFYSESSDIFHPRIFERGDKSGITGMEFPIYNFVIFIMLKIFGYANWYGRPLSLLLGTLGLFWFWRFAALELGETAGFFSLLALAASPLYFFYSRVIQPDIPMLSLLLGSFYFIKVWELEGKRRSFWQACVLFTLAGLIKLPAIIFLPYLAVTVFRKDGWQSLRKFGNYAFFAAPIFLVGGWYIYSAYLVQAYGLKYYYLGDDLNKSLLFLANSRFFKVAFVTRLPEIVANFATALLALAGLALYSRIKFPYNVLLLLLLLIPYYAIGGYHLYLLDYYSLPVAPVLALIAGAAAWHMLINGKAWLRGIIITILIASPIIGVVRTRTWYKSVHPEFPLVQKLVEENTPRNALVIAAWKDDPTLLFYTFRNGWPLSPEEINLAELHDRGARYLIAVNDDSLRPADRDRLSPIARDSIFTLYSIADTVSPTLMNEGDLR